jgi:hypothetical protein
VLTKEMMENIVFIQYGVVKINIAYYGCISVTV